MQTPQEIRAYLAAEQTSVERARSYLDRIQYRLGDPLANAIRDRLNMRESTLARLQQRVDIDHPQS